MKNIIITLISTVGLLCMNACSSTSYFADSMYEENPVSFKTYMTEEHCDENVNRIMALRIKNAIDISLTERGYSRSEDADFLVQYFVKLEQKSFVQTLCNYYDRWEGGESCEARVIDYEEGTIVIDLIDTKNNSIFWHGAITCAPFDDLKDPNQQLLDMVRNLFEKYYFTSARDQGIIARN